MATSNFLFTTLAGTETAGYTSINTLISSIDTQLNKRVPNKDSSGTGAYDNMVPMYSNAAASGFTQGLIDAANIATGAITEDKIASGAVTNSKIGTNAVTLGTQTTGDYVASISAGGTNEIATTGTGEGAAATVRLADNTALRGAATVATPPTYSGGVAGTANRIPDAKYVTDALAYATSGNVTLAGDVTGNASANTIGTGAVTSAKILDGTIVNGDINASAAISYSKLNLSGAIQLSDLAFTLETNWGTPVTYTASTTLATTDQGKKFIQFNHASTAGTFTIPNSSSYPVGCEINLMQIGAAQLTIQAGTNVSINGTPATTQGTGSSGTGTFKLRTQYSSATLVKRTTSTVDTWFIIGDLVA